MDHDIEVAKVVLVGHSANTGDSGFGLHCLFSKGSGGGERVGKKDLRLRHEAFGLLDYSLRKRRHGVLSKSW